LPQKPGTLIFVKNGIEIEPVYITGDFTVEANYRDGKGGILAGNFSISDWRMPAVSDIVKTGYPFFVGSADFQTAFSLKKTNKRYFLRVDEFNAITVKVKVNGKDTGLIYWQPHMLEITDLLKNGENRIELEATNSLRNLLGPHHYDKIDIGYVPPWIFNDKNHWMDEYGLVKFGLKGIAICSLDKHK
jgi:hypothetical protein